MPSLQVIYERDRSRPATERRFQFQDIIIIWSGTATRVAQTGSTQKRPTILSDNTRDLQTWISHFFPPPSWNHKKKRQCNTNSKLKILMGAQLVYGETSRLTAQKQDANDPPSYWVFRFPANHKLFQYL